MKNIKSMLFAQRLYLIKWNFYITILNFKKIFVYNVFILIMSIMTGIQEIVLILYQNEMIKLK